MAYRFRERLKDKKTFLHPYYNAKRRLLHCKTRLFVMQKAMFYSDFE